MANGRPRRLSIGAVGSFFGVLALFALSVAIGVAIHLNVYAAKRLLTREVNAALADLPSGSVTIAEIERLSLTSVSVPSVDVDVAGVGRAHAERVRVRFDPVATLWAALAQRGVVAIHLRDVDIGLVDLTLRPEPKPPHAGPPQEAASELRLDVDQLALAHAYVHGRLSGGTVVDVDLDRLRSRAAVDGRQARAQVSTAATARAIAREPIHVELDAACSLPVGGSGHVRSASVEVAANAGEVHVDARGGLVGDSVDLELLVPETSPDAIRSLWEAAPLAAPVSLRLRAEGTFPHLEVRGDMTLGPGTARMQADVDLDGGPSAVLTLSARDVDLRAFSGAPGSRFGFDAQARLRKVEARGEGFPLEGSATVTTARGTLAGEALPRMEARVDVDARRLRATADVDEPGAPLRIDVTRDAEGRIDASLEANVPSFADVPRFARHGIVAGGRAVLRARASLVGDVVSSQVTADVYRVSLGKLAIGAGRVDARAAGSLRAPELSASAHLIALRREPYAANDLVLTLRGTPSAFDVDAFSRGGTLDALALRASVERARTTIFRDLSARLERGGEVVSMTADRMELGTGVASVDDLRIDGLGGPVSMTARRSPDKLTAAISAPALDLDRLATILGVSHERLGGSGSLQVSFDIARSHNSGDVHLVLSGGKFGTLPELDAAVDLGLEGPSIHGLFSVRSRELGGLHLETTGMLSGPLVDSGSLIASTGRVTISTDRISVARFCAVFPCPDEVKRIASAMRPLVEARIDIERDGRATGRDTHVKVDVEANDRAGPLAHFDLDSSVDLLHALSTRRLPLDAPLEANLAVESRPLDDFPDDVRPSGLAGKVTVRGHAEGTIGKPLLVLEVTGAGLRFAGAARDAPSLDARWVTNYDFERAASDITVRSGSEEVVRASAQVDASLERLLAGGERGWRGGGVAEIHRFPLSVLPLESDERLNGRVDGRISASGIHDQPRIEAHLSVDELRVGRDSAGPVTLALEADERTLTASLDAGGTPGPDRGRATVRGRAGCAWRNAVVPALDPNAPIDVSLDATRFAVATAEPVVDRWVERLRGTLDAHLRATRTVVGDAKTWILRGEAHLRDGNILPIAIGREIQRIELDLDAQETGTVRIQRISGELGAGRFTGHGSLELRNTTLERAQGEFHIPRSQAIPMTMEGVSYGTLWGDIFADARVREGELLVDVRAPTLRVELPPQRTAELESLQDDPNVLVLQPLVPPESALATGGGPGEGAPRPLRIVIGFELGKNVGISREDMKVELMTPPPPENPKLILEGSPRIDGTIRILGGRVPVAGRVFRIERGVVRFSGNDPSNPALDIDAVFEGADTSATRINVHVGGTAKDIKLALTSSPAKSESELLAILAFGEPAPSGGLGGPSAQMNAAGTGAGANAATAAAGVGSAVLTSGINQLLSQSILPIRTSLSTGAATLASASVELTERVRVQYIRQFGAIQYGQPLDANQFALDWRFKPRWMLRTVVGDRGTTTLDVLWNRWY